MDDQLIFFKSLDGAKFAWFDFGTNWFFFCCFFFGSLRFLVWARYIGVDFSAHKFEIARKEKMIYNIWNISTSQARRRIIIKYNRFEHTCVVRSREAIWPETKSIFCCIQKCSECSVNQMILDRLDVLINRTIGPLYLVIYETREQSLIALYPIGG